MVQCLFILADLNFQTFLRCSRRNRRPTARALSLSDLNSLQAPVMVIGATNRADSLDPALRRAGRFDREICLGIPDEAARLRSVCRRRGRCLSVPVSHSQTSFPQNLADGGPPPDSGFSTESSFYSLLFCVRPGSSVLLSTPRCK